MIDTLVDLRDAIAERRAPAALGIEPREYVLVTLHRPTLVDGVLLAPAIAALSRLAEVLDVVFPVYPRTRARVRELAPAVSLHPRLWLLDPLRYLDFLSLMEAAAGVLTDSGGDDLPGRPVLHPQNEYGDTDHG
jgi:UDP-N-acetylglucosamine 2-epimerase (non-hydrolysing)